MLFALVGTEFGDSFEMPLSGAGSMKSFADCFRSPNLSFIYMSFLCISSTPSAPSP